MLRLGISLENRHRDVICTHVICTVNQNRG